ncbi:MAG: hypothetical protein ACC628_24040, partial [Pirellulaceae bacterium]
GRPMIADLNPYPAMKDSGVEWLGEVPEHWEILPPKRKLRSESSGGSIIKNTAANEPKHGYEVSFTRYFYKPQPMRSLEEIRADILALEKETEGLLDDIVGLNP